MTLPPVFRTLVPLLALIACGDGGEEATDTPSDLDAVQADTDTDTDTDTDADTHGNNGYLDPDSVPLPDPAFYDYSASITFQIDDVIGGYDGLTVADDPSILCDEPACPQSFVDAPESGLLAIDSDFGHVVQDFLGSFAAPRNGAYDDGFVGSMTDPGGVHNGLRLSSVATNAYQAGYPRGSWCGGLGGDLIKCSSEHFVSMEHALTCYETIPYLSYDPVTGDARDPKIDDVCLPLEVIPPSDVTQLVPYGDDFVAMLTNNDYAVTLKDDGKYLYRWGTWEKIPTDVRLVTSIPLPPEWHGTDVYRVTRAELAIVHTISNSPNDQIRPEDLENEAATGRTPSYTAQPDGTWTSNVDCYESDGHPIPAGTVLKNPAWAIPGGGSSDLIKGFTNAWYTTVDRDPYEPNLVTGVGPRWRLKAPKFGQDIPGVDIPTVNCMEPPIQKDFIKYNSGDLTVTVIDLLDWVSTAESPLLYSTGWMSPTVQEMSDTFPGVTVNGTKLTEEFDLAVYIKGEYKTQDLYKAVLYLDYELAN